MQKNNADLHFILDEWYKIFKSNESTATRHYYVYLNIDRARCECPNKNDSNYGIHTLKYVSNGNLVHVTETHWSPT